MPPRLRALRRQGGQLGAHPPFRPPRAAMRLPPSSPSRFDLFCFKSEMRNDRLEHIARSVFPKENTDLGEFRGNTPIANARPCIGNMKSDPPGREKWGISLTEWDFPEMGNSTIRACAFSERGSKSARGCVFSSLTTFLTQRAQELAHG